MHYFYEKFKQAIMEAEPNGPAYQYGHRILHRKCGTQVQRIGTSFATFPEALYCPQCRTDVEMIGELVVEEDFPIGDRHVPRRTDYL